MKIYTVLHFELECGTYPPFIDMLNKSPFLEYFKNCDSKHFDEDLLEALRTNKSLRIVDFGKVSRRPNITEKVIKFFEEMPLLEQFTVMLPNAAISQIVRGFKACNITLKVVANTGESYRQLTFLRKLRS